MIRRHMIVIASMLLLLTGATAEGVHVDLKTQKRTPKMSASFFRETAKRNAERYEK